jgi:hypothetical protein
MAISKITSESIAANTINNSLLSNNSVTINGTQVSLGGSGTIPGANVTSIPNSSLANSSLTINGTQVSLGSSATISGGKIIQVIASTPTNVNIFSNTYVDVISFSITPSSASNKVLVTFSSMMGIFGNNQRLLGKTQLLRNGTLVYLNSVGPQFFKDVSGYGGAEYSGTFCFLDSPNSTSQVTYSVQANEDSDQWSNYQGATLILMEISP